MTGILGSVLILAGFFGEAFRICRDYRKRIFLLKKMQCLYEQMKYEISYGKGPIPILLERLSKRSDMIFQVQFQKIADEMCVSGKPFEKIWKSHLQDELEGTPLRKQEQELLLCFPEKQGFLEEGAQAKALDELIRELQNRIMELEKEQKSKNKMVMSMGIAGGMLLSILLL